MNDIKRSIAEFQKNLQLSSFRATETMADDPKKPINPAALAIPDAARLLAKVSGRPIAEELLRRDISAGAPTNADGTLNLVRYAAWLARELHRSGEEPHAQ